MKEFLLSVVSKSISIVVVFMAVIGMIEVSNKMSVVNSNATDESGQAIPLDFWATPELDARREEWEQRKKEENKS